MPNSNESLPSSIKIPNPGDVALELAIMPAHCKTVVEWLEPKSKSRLQFPVYKRRGLRLLACFAQLSRCDVAVERPQVFTGDVARLEADGRTFAVVVGGTPARIRQSPEISAALEGPIA
jgi:hypothetical protein